MHTKPFLPIKVYKWLSATKKQLYIFDDTNNIYDDEIHIKETIYQDYSIEDAVNRIGIYINKNNNEPFYAWIKPKSLLFSIKNSKWKGYHINPFKAKDLSSTLLNESISYEYHNKELFEFDTINIVFEKDLPNELQKNKYYFTDLKANTLQYYKNHDDKLHYLKRLEVNNNVLSEQFSRVNLFCKLKEVFLADIFDIMHTSKSVDMVQWIDDTSRILYKLNKNHKIKKEWLTLWTNVDKINRINVLNIYSVFAKNSYCKISIDNNNILFNYILDMRSYIKIKDLFNHKKQMVHILQNVLKQPLKLQEESMYLSVRIEIHNSSFKNLIKKLGEYIDIFHIIKTESNSSKMSITCMYKRSSNYGQNTDIYDYIKSRLNVGISKQELIQELQNLGVTGNLDNMIENEADIQPVDDKEKFKLKENGTILVIEPYAQGYNISILNCPTYKQLQYLLYWLSRIISLTKDIKKHPNIIKQQSPVKSPQKSSKSSSSSSSSMDHGSIDFDLDSMGGTTGGAGVKSNYLINMLQQADKELFGENYARDKCQNMSQPVVFSKEYKEQLEKNNQMYFDNILEYGSSPNVQNFYACPRLWCPQSKIPLDVNDVNAQCPLPNEKPIEMFWDKDKKRARYVKLIKPNEKNICVPCCMKKEPKTNEYEKCYTFLKDNKANDPKIQVAYNDENYIMNQAAPIPVGRYGNIPEYLHKIMFEDNIKAEICNKALNKTQQCFVRKGIKNSKNNSIMIAIADILNFKNKQSFVNDIKNKLDLLNFLALDNGNICKQFMSLDLITEENKLLKSFNKFKRTSLYNLNIHQYNASRALNIYNAYCRFLDFIATDKSILIASKYLQSLILLLYNTTILIWEKIDKTDDIFLYCPQYSTMIDLNPSFCMLIKDGKYFEPVYLKNKNSNGLKVFKLDSYPKLENIVKKCLKSNPDLSQYKNIYTLNNWVKSKVLRNYQKFTMKHIFINSDLTIDKFLTSGNILLKCNKIEISFLPSLINECSISKQNIIFYDDFIGNRYNINIYKKDFQLFFEKCTQLDITINMGKVKKETDEELYNENTIDAENLDDKLIIHTNNNKELNENLQRIQYMSKNWIEMQKMVIKTIIKEYTDNDLLALNDLDRESKINTLMNLFKNIPHKKNLRIILDEIHLYSKKDLKKWLSNIIVLSKYNFLHNGFKENKTKTEFIFSQNALIRNGIKYIPDNILIHHRSSPNITHTSIDNIQDIQIDQIKDNQNKIQLPKIFTGKYEKLSSKWIMHKKSKWSNMVFIKCNYDENIIPDLVKWLSTMLGIKITFDDIEKSIKNQYFEIIENKEEMMQLLHDPAYFQIWQNIVNKKFATIQLFWDNFYVKLPKETKIKYLSAILNTTKLPANDLHILAIAKLFNLSILIIHRGKYGKFDVAKARGDLEDLLLSSTFYESSTNMDLRPLIIFNKINEKQLTAYYLVVENNPNIYMKYIDVPENIQLLVEAHKTHLL
jgi:hypothetical protein